MKVGTVTTACCWGLMTPPTGTAYCIPAGVMMGIPCTLLAPPTGLMWRGTADIWSGPGPAGTMMVGWLGAVTEETVIKGLD